MNNTLSISFQVKKSKLNSKGKAPIYARVTVNDVRQEFSIKKSVDPTKWVKTGYMKGNNEEAKSINAHVDTVRRKLEEHFRQILEAGEIPTTKLILEKYAGKNERDRTLIQLLESHNDEVKNLIGKGFSKATYVKYCTTLKHLKNFIQWQYGRTDVSLKNLNYEFITEFDYYMKTECNCGQNATMKYVRNIKKIVNRAVDNQWLPNNPFNRFKITFEKVDREYLSESELNCLMEKPFTIDRLAQVRDIFVFACFTGLAFKDLQRLTKQNITLGIDGKSYLTYTRIKTNVSARIPLLPIPQAIIEKYNDYPPCIANNKLLPLLSNQKMNAYLKEIGDLCGISKSLTTHVGRHTFATTVTLTNNVPLETVSKMLGHTNIRTTQIYARVVDKKIEQDMSPLYAKYQAEALSRKQII